MYLNSTNFHLHFYFGIYTHYKLVIFWFSMEHVSLFQNFQIGQTFSGIAESRFHHSQQLQRTWSAFVIYVNFCFDFFLSGLCFRKRRKWNNIWKYVGCLLVGSHYNDYCKYSDVLWINFSASILNEAFRSPDHKTIFLVLF